MRILLVEDDDILANGLSLSLKDWGFEVTLAISGNFANSALATQAYDLVILDLGLPDLDGRDILRKLRGKKSPIPVLILTARIGLNDRISGLDLGADDYMTKPFELRELEARVKALLRRAHGGFNHQIQFGNLTLDSLNQQISYGGSVMAIPPRENRLLVALMLEAGRVISKEKLAQRLTQHHEELADNAIEVYVHRLRKRLEPLGLSIRTLRGLGYLLQKNHE